MKNRGFIKKFILFYQPFWGRFAVSWGLVVISTLFSMLTPYSIGKIIDAANSHDFRLAYTWALVGLSAMLACRAVIRCIQYIYEIKNIDYDVERIFLRLGLDKMNELSIGQHQNQNSGVKQDVVTSGCASLLQFNELFLYNISFMLLHAVIGLSVLFYNEPLIALVTGSSIAVCIGLSLWFNKRNKGVMDDLVKKSNSSQKRYTDYVRNIALLLVNSNEASGIANYEKARLGYEAVGKEYWVKCVKVFNLGNAVSVINIGLVLMYCIYLYSAGKISLGDISIYMFWVNITTGFLENFNGTVRNLMRISAKIKKFFHFLDIEPDITVPTDATKLANFSGRIEFRDVSFTYPEWHYFKDFEDDGDEDDEEDEDVCEPQEKRSGPILDKVSFCIAPREKVAFVGASGAGKSSIISLLLRAYDPQAGQILLDEQDLKEIDLKSYRRQVGLVEQDIMLMDDTIMNNLLVGMNGRGSETSDEELWQALEKAGLSKLKKRLKKGLDTDIGERGIKLSGGEKQRLAIARALLKKAPLIIFDEATSNLDSIKEAEIHEAMDRISGDITCIFIAHRLATVKNADRIFVIEEGRIIAEGKHAELLETCETYRKLVERQVVAF